MIPEEPKPGEQKPESRQVRRQLQRTALTMDQLPALENKIINEVVKILSPALQGATGGMGNAINESATRLSAIAYLLQAKGVLRKSELYSAIETFKTAFEAYENLLKEEKTAEETVDIINTKNLPIDGKIVDKILKSGYDRLQQVALVISLGLTEEVLNERQKETSPTTPTPATESKENREG